MGKPKLLVIAGCNGSGKSSFSNALSPIDTIPYDYDKVYKDKFESLLPFDLRDKMAHNLTREHLQSTINNSLENKLSFCYETNFNSTPLYWPEKFKSKGYTLEIIFFCLNSIEKAKKRVLIRYENGGHFVPDKELESRYYLGYENLNNYWSFFDTTILYETNAYNSIPKQILTIRKNLIIGDPILPEYLEKFLPSIGAQLH